jgi:lipopolysaccharide export system permease protein
MTRILDRLVARSFLKLFLAFVLGAPLLFILGDATENLDRYLDRGLPLGQVLLSYAFQYPQFVFWSFPIAALLATVFTLQPMTVHREVMASKAGGISFHRLTLPLYVLGLVFTVVGLGISEVVPRATQISAELREDRERRQSWRGSFVYLTDAGESLMARRLDVPDRRMLGVVLFREPGPNGDPALHIIAEVGLWEEGPDGNGHWEFFDGQRRELHADGTETLQQFESLVYEDLAEDPSQLVQTVLDEDEMTRGELSALAERVIRSGGDADRLLVKREQRIAIPIATLIIILFGAPLATSSKRGGAAFGIGVSLGTTILYLMLFRVFGSAGYAGALDPFLAAWIPNLIFFVAGLILTLRVRT